MIGAGVSMDDRELRPILDFIESFTHRSGFPPSYAEIAEGCGLSSVGHVQYRVNRLVERGLLEHTPGRARSLRLAASARSIRRSRGERFVNKLAGFVRRRRRGESGGGPPE